MMSDSKKAPAPLRDQGHTHQLYFDFFSTLSGTSAQGSKSTDKRIEVTSAGKQQEKSKRDAIEGTSTKGNKMKVRNAKQQLIECKIRGLGCASKAWSAVFGHVIGRLDDSLCEDGFNLVFIDGTLCHAVEVSLAEIYTTCPQHPESTLRNALRYLIDAGFLLYDVQKTVPGQARTISAPEFAIADTAQLLGLLCEHMGRPFAAASEGSQRCFQTPNDTGVTAP